MRILLMCGCFFFFFKQKTAYEIRKGDWSSDVCSSDLAPAATSSNAAALASAVPTLTRLVVPWARRVGTARGRGSRPRALENELGEEPDADRRRTLGLMRPLAVGVRGARDVEVYPRIPLDEFSQEPPAGDRPRTAPARVLHVGDDGFEEVAVLIPQRQRPTALTGALSRLTHFRQQGLIVSHRAYRYLAERDHHGAGERRGRSPPPA